GGGGWPRGARCPRLAVHPADWAGRCHFPPPPARRAIGGSGATGSRRSCVVPPVSSAGHGEWCRRLSTGPHPLLPPVRCAARSRFRRGLGGCCARGGTRKRGDATPPQIPAPSPAAPPFAPPGL